MTSTITYSLLTNQPDSDDFYRKLSDFTDVVLHVAGNGVEKYARSYRQYVVSSGIETPRTNEEYIFELLMAGVFGQIYGQRAASLSQWVCAFMKTLSSLRKTKPKLKGPIDKIRGILLTSFFAPFAGESMAAVIVDRKLFGSLLDYLDASGEFKQEVIRLRLLQLYLNQLEETEANSLLNAAGKFARWFRLESKISFSVETQNVTRFLFKKHLSYRWKEDVLFAGRAETEYHLNMVGAEIMNRALRKEFSGTKRKVVLAPACMRLKEDAECRALRKGKDISCTHCSAQCEVNKLTKLGIIDGFDVAIIPHSSDFSEWLERWKGNKEVGVVGVACVLNLLTGGYETKALGIPAQCVFLDYCGCQKHWDKTGIPTQLNKTQLSTILSYRMEKSVRKELHPVRRRTITTLCCN